MSDHEIADALEAGLAKSIRQLGEDGWAGATHADGTEYSSSDKREAGEMALDGMGFSAALRLVLSNSF